MCDEIVDNVVKMKEQIQQADGKEQKKKRQEGMKKAKILIT